MAAKFFPLEFGHIVTSGFGSRWGTTHWGTDYGWPGGSANKPVYAVQGGTVVMVGPASGFGQWVVLDHPTGDGGGTTVYGHIIPEVRIGQRVSAGQRIARINPDSNTNGGVAPHLHLEWHRFVWVGPGSNRLDPQAMLAGAKFPGAVSPDAPLPPITPPPPPPARQWGIDVSNHQRGFDFAAARREGFTWATHKVTEGDWRDPEWPRAREEMRKHFPGLFGGYVYCHAENDPGYEADKAIEWLGDRSIPVQIDYEDTDRRGRPSVGDLCARVDAYLARGITLLPVYIPRWYWRDWMGAGDLAPLRDRGVGLWNSDYVNGSDFASRLYPGDGYKGWEPFSNRSPAVTFLQFSERGRVAGMSIDVNAYRGTEDQLRAVFRGDHTPQEAELNADERNMLMAIHREVTQKYASRSQYRQNDEPVDTMAGFVLNGDGRSHEALVEVRKLGEQVAKLAERVEKQLCDACPAKPPTPTEPVAE